MNSIVRSLEKSRSEVARIEGNEFDPAVQEPLRQAITALSDAIEVIQRKDREAIMSAYGKAPTGGVREG